MEMLFRQIFNTFYCFQSTNCIYADRENLIWLENMNDILAFTVKTSFYYIEKRSKFKIH